MREAYWLAFALALTPILMQLVATIFFWPITSIALRRRRGYPETRALWPYLLFVLLAFGLMLYQTGWVAVLYIPGPDSDFLAESVEVLGVSIPLELGENVNAFVNSVVFLLLSLFFIGFFVFILIRGFRELRVRGSVAGWVFVLAMLFFMGMAIRSAWRTLPYQIDNLRALF